MHRVAKPGFYDACKRGAAQVEGYGKPLRSITTCHCFEFGVTTAMSHGRNYSIIGDYRTFN